jgi:hypothetical protein
LTVKNKYPIIKYTSRDFNSIKNDLVEYAKRYYPDTYQDFNEAGFGSLMLDTVSYVGDILSFYLDYSVNENFLDTAIEFDNVLKLGRQLGYRFRGSPSSFGVVDFYVIVPANTNGIGPNTSYMGYLRRGTSINSDGGIGFILNQDVNFADSTNEVVVAKVNQQTGLPTHYAVKSSGQIISGEIKQEQVELGSFEEFKKIKLTGENITEIISVSDSEGNFYFEVDYLSQDVVFNSVNNYNPDSSTTPQVIKPVIVPRRFTVERLEDGTYLQFGGANQTSTTTDPLTDPAKTIVNYHARDFFTALSIDPSNLLKTPSLGVAPSDTTLTVTYRSNTQETVNVAAGGITKIIEPIFDFDNLLSLEDTKVQGVINSLEVSNEEPINGDVTLPGVEELKLRVYDSFSAQRRAVTQQDYKSLIYAMPPEFGAIKRANVIRDPDSFKRNINIYVISENSEGLLETTNATIKNNLRTWLNQGRMLNDTIDIIDAKIVNYGIDFEVVGDLETNKFEILNNCNLALINFFSDTFEIGESVSITDVYNILNQVNGVVDTTSVDIVIKTGINYSETRFNVARAISADGRFISVPSNVIMEIKFPATDIIGSVK